MQPPSVKKLNFEDYRGAPSWLFQLFVQLNNALGGFVNVLNKNVSRADNLAAGEAVDIAFTTKTPAASTFPLAQKFTTAAAPKHVVLSKLVQQNGQAIASAFSMTWGIAQNGTLQLWLQGLSDATAYKISIIYE